MKVRTAQVYRRSCRALRWMVVGGIVSTGLVALLWFWAWVLFNLNEGG